MSIEISASREELRKMLEYAEMMRDRATTSKARDFWNRRIERIEQKIRRSNDGSRETKPDVNRLEVSNHLARIEG